MPSQKERRSNVHVLIAAASAAALVLAACSGGISVASERTITIEMREFGYLPSTIKLAPGERVTLNVKNAGTVEHEFMAGRNAMIGKGYGQDWLARATAEHGGGHDTGHSGSGVRLNAKGNASISLVVPDEKGEFEFGCFVPGHYEGGMKGKLVVE
jgi:uncharacterized cupredoxin-like copper-binding protein